VGPVLAADELSLESQLPVLVADPDGDARHAGGAPAGQLARADGDVGQRIHQRLPGHAAQAIVGAAAVLVENATDAHQSAVLGVDPVAAHGDVEGVLVEIALVDHHAITGWGQIVFLGRRRHRAGDVTTGLGGPGRVCHRTCALTLQMVLARQPSSGSSGGAAADRTDGIGDGRRGHRRGGQRHARGDRHRAATAASARRDTV